MHRLDCVKAVPAVFLDAWTVVLERQPLRQLHAPVVVSLLFPIPIFFPRCKVRARARIPLWKVSEACYLASWKGGVIVNVQIRHDPRAVSMFRVGNSRDHAFNSPFTESRQYKETCFRIELYPTALYIYIDIIHKLCSLPFCPFLYSSVRYGGFFHVYPDV